MPDQAGGNVRCRGWRSAGIDRRRRVLARIGDLERTDQAIAEAARRHDLEALLAAIEAREDVAAAVLAAIAEDDRRQQARSAPAEAPGRDTSVLFRWLADRDREMEALARLVDSRTSEYNRILHVLRAGRRRWR